MPRFRGENVKWLQMVTEFLWGWQKNSKIRLWWLLYSLLLYSKLTKNHWIGYFKSVYVTWIIPQYNCKGEGKRGEDGAERLKCLWDDEWMDRLISVTRPKISAKQMSEPILRSELDYKILILPTSRSKGTLKAVLLNFARINSIH